MNSPKNFNSAVRLGYLNPSSGSPLIVTDKFPPVTESVPIPLLPSIQTVPISPVQEKSLDEIMKQLQSHGYIIENKITSLTNCYFISRTRFGDKILIKIDNYSVPPSTNDIHIEKRSSLMVVPQEIKAALLSCLEHGICSVAFISNNGMCITQKMADGTPNFSEENFIVSSGKLNGNTIIPIVSLSDILANPMIEEKISKVGNELSKMAFTKLNIYQEDLLDAIKRLTIQSQNLSKFVKEAENTLSDEINKLSSAYEKIKHINPETLSTLDQADYYAIQRGLANKKELQSQIINSLANAYKTSEMIRSISEELRSVDPVLSAFRESVGVV